LAPPPAAAGGLVPAPAAADTSRSPSRRIWIESSFVSVGKGDLLPTNFGSVNDDDPNEEDMGEDLDDDEILIGDVNYSDGQIR
jgi:hypothetical protein